MTRYVVRARATRADDGDWWDRGPLVPHLTVDGSAEVDTRLIDQHGNPIMRVAPPIGFGRDAEW